MEKFETSKVYIKSSRLPTHGWLHSQTFLKSSDSRVKPHSLQFLQLVIPLPEPFKEGSRVCMQTTIQFCPADGSQGTSLLHQGSHTYAHLKEKSHSEKSSQVSMKFTFESLTWGQPCLGSHVRLLIFRGYEENLSCFAFLNERGKKGVSPWQDRCLTCAQSLIPSQHQNESCNGHLGVDTFTTLYLSVSSHTN